MGIKRLDLDLTGMLLVARFSACKANVIYRESSVYRVCCKMFKCDAAQKLSLTEITPDTSTKSLLYEAGGRLDTL